MLQFFRNLFLAASICWFAILTVMTLSFTVESAARKWGVPEEVVFHIFVGTLAIAAFCLAAGMLCIAVDLARIVWAKFRTQHRVQRGLTTFFSGLV